MSDKFRLYLIERQTTNDKQQTTNEKWQIKLCCQIIASCRYIPCGYRENRILFLDFEKPVQKRNEKPDFALKFESGSLFLCVNDKQQTINDKWQIKLCCQIIACCGYVPCGYRENKSLFLDFEEPDRKRNEEPDFLVKI